MNRPVPPTQPANSTAHPARWHHLRLLLCLLLLLLSSCGPNEAALEATADVLMAAAVVATVDALPTGTPPLTLTPLPTFTDAPTLTAQPTLTALPSLTPRPTLTAMPTLTPLPTETSTSTPTETATPAPISGAQTISGGETFSINHINMAVYHIQQMLTALIRQCNRYIGYSCTDWNPGDDCAGGLASYDSIDQDCRIALEDDPAATIPKGIVGGDARFILVDLERAIHVALQALGIQ